ncbi:MAG: hypothetical protein BMS9Abin37_0320 [Acidobacteriota bacterium]|nr:MAG: hypothetical protein BMS9Abin37_0320 [Acidobacteriota bacterium]
MPSGKHPQSSGFSRREALRYLGSASALPLVPTSLTNDPLIRIATGASWQPRFLEANDVETVASLSECVIVEPPSARDAEEVLEYIDLALSRAEPAVQTSFNEGLSWLDEYVSRSMRKRFTELASDQQHELLAAISDTSRSHEPKGYAFLTQIKQLTIEGYYRSETG